MTVLPFQQRNSLLLSPGKAHLSYSSINKYLLCPEQYRFYYIGKYRPKYPPASFAFGITIHQALSLFFKKRDDPFAFFESTWNEAREIELRYAYRESWEKLAERGKLLLEKFLDEGIQRVGIIHASEKAFELNVSNLELPFVGIIDLIADLDGKRSVVDFKTSSSSYEDHEADLSDQLTAYQLAEPGVEQCALCVFVKTKEPKIEWFTSTRTGVQFTEYLKKVEWIGQAIAAQQFYKRPGQWCKWCDYLPLCLGDRQRTEETLIQIESESGKE